MGSHRRTAPSSGPERSTALALGLLSAAATALGAVPATAAPQEDTRAEVDRLHREAEKATEAYNAADERADALRREIADAQDAIARKQQRVNTMREALGSLAGSQYRSGGLDPALALLLSEDPEDYLRRASVLDRIGVHRAAELKRLRGTLRSLSQDRAEAAKRLGALDRSRKAAATHKRTVQKKLTEARRLLASLPAGERAAWDRASRSGRTDLPARPRRRPRLGTRGRRRRRRPLRPRQALRVGRQRPRLLRLLRAHPVGVRAGRGRPAAHLAGPAVRRTYRYRCPRPAPATWSSTGPTPPTWRCTWATAR